MAKRRSVTQNLEPAPTARPKKPYIRKDGTPGQEATRIKKAAVHTPRPDRRNPDFHEEIAPDPTERRLTANLGRGSVQTTPHVQRVAAAPGSKATSVAIDLQILHTLAVTHMPFHRMAMILGVSSGLLSTHPTYRAVIDKARAVKKRELLEAMFVTAINDRNPTMQIWLSKQYLDHKDVSRIENTGAGGGPMQQAIVQVTAVIPDNGRDSGRGPVTVIPPDTVLEGTDIDADDDGDSFDPVPGDGESWEPDPQAMAAGVYDEYDPPKDM